MSVEGDLQHSLRIGDTVLLYVKDAHGYVFSELSRYAPRAPAGSGPSRSSCDETCSPYSFSLQLQAQLRGCHSSRLLPGAQPCQRAQ